MVVVVEIRDFPRFSSTELQSNHLQHHNILVNNPLSALWSSNIVN
jgi:hypothetical protein